MIAAMIEAPLAFTTSSHSPPMLLAAPPSTPLIYLTPFRGQRSAMMAAASTKLLSAL
jgi:hypothetical protein